MNIAGTMVISRIEGTSQYVHDGPNTALRKRNGAFNKAVKPIFGCGESEHEFSNIEQRPGIDRGAV